MPTTYMLKVTGGKVRDDQAPLRDDEGKAIKQPKMHVALWVERELNDMGIKAWCGRLVTFERRGKNRYWEMKESPMFANYVFVEADTEQILRAIYVDHVSPTFSVVAKSDLQGRKAMSTAKGDPFNAPEIIGLQGAMVASDAAYEAAQRVDANNRASVVAYKAGDAIQKLTGAFSDITMKFDKLVSSPDVPWQMVQADVPMMGQTVKMRFDPIDVAAMTT